MTQGLPVIAGRTCTIEQIVPESSIFTFELGNARDIANTITLMSKNPQLVFDKIANSRELVKKFSWDKEQNSLLSMYKSLRKS
jgi:glycosyltransferase involved in cell wall biosynthesis